MLKPRFLPTGNLPGRAGTVRSRVWASDVIQHDVEAADVDMIRFVGFLFCLFLPVTYSVWREHMPGRWRGKTIPRDKVREMAWARAQQHRSHQHQDSMDLTPLYPQGQHRSMAVAHAEGWSPAVFWP